jgi:hypothetical protein
MLKTAVITRTYRVTHRSIGCGVRDYELVAAESEEAARLKAVIPLGHKIEKVEPL